MNNEFVQVPQHAFALPKPVTPKVIQMTPGQAALYEYDVVDLLAKRAVKTEVYAFRGKGKGNVGMVLHMTRTTATVHFHAYTAGPSTFVVKRGDIVK